MTTFVLAGLIFLLAGLVQGVTGFGAGLLAIPLLCLIIDVKLAIPLCILNGLVITSSMAYQLRHALERRKILPLLIASIPGALAGAAVLKQVDPLLIKRLLGILLISYSSFNLLFRPRPINPPVVWAYIAGFLTGAITAALSAGGPPAIIYTTLTDWKKEEIKATLTGFFAFNGYITAIIHAMSGMTTQTTVQYFLVTLPFVLAGTLAGLRLTDRINRRTYLRLVYCLLMGLGLLMIVG